MPKHSLIKQIDTYIESTFIPHDPDLAFALNNSKKHNLPPIHITPVMGKLLSSLAKQNHAKRILEIGTLGGYSTLWLAKALQKKGTIVTIEHNDEYAIIAQENFEYSQHAPQIDLRIGEAFVLLPKLKTEAPFDFFFIDANKEEYIEYVEWAIKLAHPGSIIVCDNVLRNGGVLQNPPEKEYYAKLQKFNVWLAKNDQLESTILPITLPLTGRDYVDGMSMSIVK